MLAEVKNKRVTMIKHTVGNVKTPAYALPNSDFVYGIESKLDIEGAGDVVQSWAQSEPSKPPCSMQSFPATNRQALKNGCLTSKSQREYGKKFPVMKQNPKQTNKCFVNDSNPLSTLAGKQVHSSSDDNPHSFGIQSKKDDVSMTVLLRSISSELKGEIDYPDLSGKKRKGRLPPAKSTKSSRLVQQCREPSSSDEVAARLSVDEFKMKRFLNVKSKVRAYRESNR
ncbi:hypothetical protein HJC23_004990 [Cyclotella cryptica]|uniref:Uncharacterized protein n=1 Tax=Cyclotella cryptica TaxID=29204 RepID=A0ABD3P5Y4_9STRA|eukprot:CCRYP_017087-RA/>CCRYP_017087-RA protein AED:0.03 eAED:0.03 QI:552/1/1/1/1/1/2/188/225